MSRRETPVAVRAGISWLRRGSGPHRSHRDLSGPLPASPCGRSGVRPL